LQEFPAVKKFFFFGYAKIVNHCAIGEKNSFRHASFLEPKIRIDDGTRARAALTQPKK
jgi:hypothetical protein